MSATADHTKSIGTAYLRMTVASYSANKDEETRVIRELQARGWRADLRDVDKGRYSLVRDDVTEDEAQSHVLAVDADEERLMWEPTRPVRVVWDTATDEHPQGSPDADLPRVVWVPEECFATDWDLDNGTHLDWLSDEYGWCVLESEVLTAPTIRINLRSTDRTRIAAAFEALSALGVVAKADVACCQTCGWAELDSEYGPRAAAVFFHDQSADAFRVSGVTGRLTSNLHHSMCMYWRGEHTPGLVRAEFARVGLTVEHDGSPTQALIVLPRITEAPRP